ncbi:GBF-interacting protein 1-like isoform X2 [Mangifera indica]|uniref:GBF-interacting protein 1-like isoform X2 n=1 Tax=Mangifera indica TaxID=29780 RepID=UPI001CFAF2AA|nr:GBF-interacting protein 1-like isoform X2 [Mangifera indica]
MSNRSSSRSKGGDAEAFRVTIPADLRPTIQTIRETTERQHSDEEIYSVLQDCSMDPNETAQKLLYLDTFHEVKKKRDRKKEGQGIRGGRGNYYSSYTPSVAGGGKNAASRRENGLIEGGSVLRKMKNIQVTHVTKASTAVSNVSSSLSNGSFSHGHGNELSVDGVVPEAKDNTTIAAKKLETAPLLPTPTFASLIIDHQEKFSLSSNHLPTSVSQASVSGAHSLASDPVLASPVPQNPAAVGTIMCEVGSQHKAADLKLIKGNKNVSLDLESSKSEKGASSTSDAVHKNEDESQSEVVKIKLSEPLQSSSLSTQDSSLAINSSDNDSQALQESVIISEETVKANSQLHPESAVFDGQHVTFPIHFKVSKEVKNGLTFGSFDTCFGSVAKDVNGTGVEINSMPAAESSSASDEMAREPSPRSRSISPTIQGETLDHPQSMPFVDNVLPTVGNILTGTNLKDELEQEMLLLPEGQEKPPVQSVPNYGLGLMFPPAVSQSIQMEGPETQAHDASLDINFANGVSVTPSSSPSPSAPSSIAAPQPVHLFRQTYPNFFPYGQYLPPYYVPPMHQFLSPNGLLQQPSSGNPAHMGIAASYGSYGSSPVGFNPIAAVTPGKSTNNEELTASQLKDNQIYTTRPQTEGSGVWIPTAGHDLSNMQINPLYNLALQGQHIAFAPAQTGPNAFPGIYQPAQTLATPAIVNPLLQQSQAVAAAVETMALPSGAYQQPQVAQLNWNPSY